MEHTHSVTIENLQAALAGESMAYIKYRYFARIAREHGDEETAQLFEHTADQEVLHAFGHLDVLYPKAQLNPVTCLEMAIAGETYEYTEMYPKFREQAEREKMQDAVAEMEEQIEESREHAEQFSEQLKKAEKRFKALINVEKRHAEGYQRHLATINA